MSRKITIVNGNPGPRGNQLDIFIGELVTGLTKREIDVETFHLRENKIRQCTGCFDCWWKTPGLCRFDDDAPELLRSVINSDLVIYTSPMSMGMYSSLLKKFHDRTIALVHPYIELIGGECHHRKRYPQYPKMGVLLDTNDSSPKEIDVTEKIFKRICLNFHSELKFYYSINNIQPKRLSHEISHL